MVSVTVVATTNIAWFNADSNLILKKNAYYSIRNINRDTNKKIPIKAILWNKTKKYPISGERQWTTNHACHLVSYASSMPFHISENWWLLTRFWYKGTRWNQPCFSLHLPFPSWHPVPNSVFHLSNFLCFSSKILDYYCVSNFVRK